MGKSGYTIIVILMVAMAWFTFRPETDQARQVHLFTAPRPHHFQLHASGLDQEVSEGVVHLHGLTRVVDNKRAQDLWFQIYTIEAPQARVQLGITPDQLGAFGIDGSCVLDAPEAHLNVRWGQKDGLGYIWEGTTQRLFPVKVETIARLDQVSGRLDDRHLIDSAHVARISLDHGVRTTTIGLSKGRWVDEIVADRFIPVSRMNSDLLPLFDRLSLESFAGHPPASAPDIGVLHLSSANPLDLDHVVRLWTVPEGMAVQVDDLPTQTVGHEVAAQWRTMLTDFSRDFIFDLRSIFLENPLVEVDVRRDGKELFLLEKHGLQDSKDDHSEWDLIWQDGREVASTAGAALIANTLDNLAVQDVQKRGSEKPPAQGLTIDFTFQLDEKVAHAAITGAPGAWRIWSDTHCGTVAELPSVLDNLKPEEMLDLTLLDRSADRVVKFQRIINDESPVRKECYAADSQGMWRQTFPSTTAARPIDQLAIAQLVRAQCVARARSARLLTAEDRSIIAAPAFEILLRFAPPKILRATDVMRLGETSQQDVGFCFASTPAGWRAVDKEGSVSYLVDPDLVALLRAPLVDNLVLPLVPSLVQRIGVIAPGRNYVLSAAIGSEEWTIQVIDAKGHAGPKRRADALEVRRLKRSLATLRAQRIDVLATPLSAKETQATIACEIPGRETTERLVLNIGRHEQGQDWVLCAESNNTQENAGYHAPSGRCYLPVSATADIEALTPPPERLLAADQAPAHQ